MAEKITTMKAPEAVGFSQGVKAGNLYVFSGQVPIDPETNEIVTGGIIEQTQRVMENMKALLDEAGLTFNNVIKSTIYLSDMNNLGFVNEVYGTYVGPVPPALVTLEVKGLPLGAFVEIDFVAVSE